MKKQIISAAVAIVLSISTAQAAQKLTDTDKIQLQAAMQKSISRQLIDGNFHYFDTKKDKIVALYPYKAHPMILTMGSDFILCSDFRDADGKKINIDFYVARRGKSFVVIDTVVDNRAPIKRLMKAGKVAVVK